MTLSNLYINNIHVATWKMYFTFFPPPHVVLWLFIQSCNLLAFHPKNIKKNSQQFSQQLCFVYFFIYFDASLNHFEAFGYCCDVVNKYYTCVNVMHSVKDIWLKLLHICMHILTLLVMHFIWLTLLSIRF